MLAVMFPTSASSIAYSKAETFLRSCLWECGTAVNNLTAPSCIAFTEANRRKSRFGFQNSFCRWLNRYRYARKSRISRQGVNVLVIGQVVD